MAHRPQSRLYRHLHSRTRSNAHPSLFLHRLHGFPPLAYPRFRCFHRRNHRPAPLLGLLVPARLEGVLQPGHSRRVHHPRNGCILHCPYTLLPLPIPLGGLLVETRCLRLPPRISRLCHALDWPVSQQLLCETGLRRYTRASGQPLGSSTCHRRWCHVRRLPRGLYGRLHL